MLAELTELPPALRDRAVVDLTEDVNAGVRQLVTQIRAAAQADFSAIGPREFERLVADLLRAVGFRLDELRHGTDPGVDLRAVYQRADPFGSAETEVWLVVAKLYAHQRVSVDAIRKLAGVLSLASGGTRGLLVTNSQLTSVAAEYMSELERSSRVRLRVLDGVELKRLLRQFPSVAARHFGGETVPDGDS